MNNPIIRTLVAMSALTTISATALAASDTQYFVIGRLDASSVSSNGYRVYPAPGYSLPDLCERNDFAEIQSSGPSANEADLMARSLATAFWSSRKVQLRLDGCGANGRPAYRIVRLHTSQ